MSSAQIKASLTRKLSFYLSAVDDLLSKKNYNSSIGILLCKSKDNVETK